jgi:hypothetical protein
MLKNSGSSSFIRAWNRLCLNLYDIGGAPHPSNKEIKPHPENNQMKIKCTKISKSRNKQLETSHF